MKKILTFTAVFSTAALLTACASNPTSSLAIQKENNQFEVTGLGKTSLIAKNNAIAAANKTCGKSTPVVINEKSEYSGPLRGVVDEQTGQLIQAAAGVLGSITGKSTGLNSDTDYQTVLTFQCQAK